MCDYEMFNYWVLSHLLIFNCLREANMNLVKSFEKCIENVQMQNQPHTFYCKWLISSRGSGIRTHDPPVLKRDALNQLCYTVVAFP